MQRNLNLLNLLPLTVALVATACASSETTSPSVNPSISVEVSISGGRTGDLPIFEVIPLVAVVRDRVTGRRLDDALVTWQMTVEWADVLADIVSFNRTGIETAEIMFLTDALAVVKVSALRLDRSATATIQLRGTSTGLAIRSENIED